MSSMDRGKPGWSFLSYGFRPFFMAAACWAAIALVIWVVAFATGQTLPSRFDPLTWHIHEMLFGVVMAAIAGFLLTAIPNWTGRLPVRGLPLAVLACLWLLGRVACLLSIYLPAAWVAAIDLAFPLVLVIAAAREIVAGRNWRNLVMLVPIALVGTGNLLMHIEAMDVAVPTGLGWRLGLGAVLMLIAVVGGRIVPSFTRNWLSKRRDNGLPVAFNYVDRLALVVLLAGLVSWVCWPETLAAGALLIAAATLHALRLLRWHGVATAAEPLLLILHIGYAWLVVGLGLLGLAVLEQNGIATGIPQSAAIHALTAGAAATMILAVMTRATRGHTGRDLTADRLTGAIYLLINAAAATRVAAAFLPDWTMLLLALSAILWVASFALFVVAYGGMLIGPQRPPKPVLNQIGERAG